MSEKVQLVKYVRWCDLKEYLPISKSTAYSLIKRGLFPPPYKLSDRVSAWNIQEVNNWLNEKKQSK